MTRQKSKTKQARGSLDPDFKRAIALEEQGKFQEAASVYTRLLNADPEHARAYHRLGLLYLRSGTPNRAAALISRSIEIDPTSADVHSHLGHACRALNRLEDALRAYDTALRLAPSRETAHCDRGIALAMQARWGEALPSFERSIALDPLYAVGHYYRGEALRNLGRLEDAAPAYERAVHLRPDFLEAQSSLAYTYYNVKRFNDALAAYKTVLALDPAAPLVKGRVLYLKMLCCEWQGLNELIVDIDRDMQDGRVSASPFEWQAVGRTPQSLQRCAELFCGHSYPAKPAVWKMSGPAQRQKIRVGYVSGEFRDQATSHLLTGVLEHHDPSRFEITLFDNGWDDGSDLRKRIAASGTLVSIRNADDDSAARLVAASDIDILVNLNGYFGEDRTGVFARRPAPIQVNYLGFPGTLGARYMDYIIADAHVIPKDELPFYDEKVVYLPHCYQPNDNRKKIGPTSQSREDAGLPKHGFVFCCFNNTYKITPEIFAIWMRILRQVEGSALWLLDVHTAPQNLREEAAKHGIDPARLVFASRVPLAEHLARHRLADLFLDTLPYNAHTTASDALWAGLPVLTQTGTTFPGYVAGSLLKAIDLPELITPSAEAYEDLALELARNPNRLETIRRKLSENRLTTPLFDTALYTQHLQTAFEAMHSLRLQGRPPAHFSV